MKQLILCLICGMLLLGCSNGNNYRSNNYNNESLIFGKWEWSYNEEDFAYQYYIFNSDKTGTDYYNRYYLDSISIETFTWEIKGNTLCIYKEDKTPRCSYFNILDDKLVIGEETYYKVSLKQEYSNIPALPHNNMPPFLV